MTRHTVFRLQVIAVLSIALAGCSRDPNVRKEKYLESGRRYFAKANYAAASIQLRNALQVDSNFAAAHYELAHTYLKLQDWNDAYRELERTVEIEPENYQARLELANLGIAGGQLHEAQEQLNDLLSHEPSNPDVHIANGNLLAAQRRLPGAIQELQRAISLNGHRGDYYVQLALLEMRDNEAPAAELTLKKAIELTPVSTRAQLTLGALYQSQHRFPEAELHFRSAMTADPRDPEPRAAIARLYMSEGRRADAEEFLRSSTVSFPDNSSGYRLLGDFYYAQGDFDKATDEYRSLYRQHPKDLQVLKNYVQLLIIKGQLNEASDLDVELLKANPNDSDGLIDRAQIDIARGDLSGAVQVLQGVIKNDPDNGLAFYHLGVTFDHMENPEQAEKAWREAVRLRPDLVEAQRALAVIALRKSDMVGLEQFSTEIISRQPGSPEGYAMRAFSYIRRGQLARAEPDVQKAIAVAPQNSSGYLELGNLMLARKNFHEAEIAYQQSLDRDQASPDALSGLMNVYFTEGKAASAFAAARSQVEKVPNSSVLEDILGTALFDRRRNTKDLADSEASLKKAIELDGHNVDAWLKLIQVQAVGSSADHAIETCRSAIQKNPDAAGIYVLLGELYMSMQSWDRAKPPLEKALVISPQNPAASNDLAFVMLQTGGNPDLAMPLAETARRGLPDSPQVADTMGWVLYEKGAYGSALGQFEEALKLSKKTKSPDNPTVHFHLGMAYQKLGRPILAREELQRVLKINPNYSRAEDVKKLLSELRS